VITVAPLKLAAGRIQHIISESLHTSEVCFYDTYASSPLFWIRKKILGQ
jgi:hypothetical protein